MRGRIPARRVRESGSFGPNNETMKGAEMIDPLPLVVAAIYGHGVKREGRCCTDMKLQPLQHPLYRCVVCGAKVRLSKITKIKVSVVPESEA